MADSKSGTSDDRIRHRWGLFSESALCRAALRDGVGWALRPGTGRRRAGLANKSCRIARHTAQLARTRERQDTQSATEPMDAIIAWAEVLIGKRAMLPVAALLLW